MYGPNPSEPHIKALGEGLFELGLQGKEGIARVLYCTTGAKQIVMLRSLIKKTRKIPVREMKIAMSRKREVKNEN